MRLECSPVCVSDRWSASRMNGLTAPTPYSRYPTMPRSRYARWTAGGVPAPSAGSEGGGIGPDATP